MTQIAAIFLALAAPPGRPPLGRRLCCSPNHLLPFKIVIGGAGSSHLPFRTLIQTFPRSRALELHGFAFISKKQQRSSGIEQSIILVPIGRAFRIKCIPTLISSQFQNGRGTRTECDFYRNLCAELDQYKVFKILLLLHQTCVTRDMMRPVPDKTKRETYTRITWKISHSFEKSWKMIVRGIELQEGPYRERRMFYTAKKDRSSEPKIR